MERRTFVQSVLGGVAGAATLGTASASDEFDGAGDPLDEVEILTDDYQVSHVYADDLYALGYGNGYVQAGDRLFQMDAVRHVGYGDSAKVLGPAQIPSDIQVKRDLYSEEEIERQWESASETLRTMVEGFTDGVNRRMTEMAANGDLPAEFAALGHPPEPWKPEDTVAAVNYLIGFFGVSGGSELSNAGTLYRIQQNLGSWEKAFDAYEDLNWLETTEDHYTSIPGEDKRVPGGETVPESWDDVPEAQKRFLDAADPDAVETWGIEADVTLPDDLRNGEVAGQGVMEGFKWGSNALVVSPELSESGEALLGGGPQMGYFKPPIPYEIGLHGAGFDVSGIGVTAAPGIVVGRTTGNDGDALAWTVTSGRDDMLDTIAVELDPDDRHRYKWNGEWYEMDTHTVEHVANPAAAALTGSFGTRVVKQEVARIEQDGDVMPVVAWNPEENVAWCQRKTTRYDELDGARQWVETGRADDLEDFRETISEFPFTFNFHVAGETGDIAYYHLGKVPERADGQDYRLPRASTDHAWYGTTTGLGLGTHAKNPSRGYVVNWNNGPAKGWRAGDGEQNWGSIHRVDELDRIVREYAGLDRAGNQPPEAASDSLNAADVREIMMQAALHDATAYESAPVFADAARGSSDDRVREMGQLLDEWADDDCDWFDRAGDGVPYTDGDDRYDHPGHAIYDEVRSLLQREVFDVTTAPGEDGGGIDWEPPVSRHAGEHGTAGSDVTFIDALYGETDFDWFGGRRDELIRAALSTAAENLEERFETPEPTQWLEPVHKSRFRSLGAAPATRMDMRNRSSYNQAIDFAGALSEAEGVWTETARHVMPPGNSGLLTAEEAATAQATGSGPPRLTNQMEPYVENTYTPHPVTREQVEQVATTSTTVRTTEPPTSGGLDESDLPDDVEAPVGNATEADRDAAVDHDSDFESPAEEATDVVSEAVEGDDPSEAVPGTDDPL